MAAELQSEIITEGSGTVAETGNRVSAFLMHRQLFESTFNELYHLGQIDHSAISLHYDDYPHIRIYKLEGAPAG